MTYKEAEAIIKTIDVSRFPIKITLQYQRSLYVEDKIAKLGIKPCNCIEVAVKINVIDIKSILKKDITVITKIRYDFHDLTKEQLISGIFDQIHFIIDHELKECFIIDGKQWQDPHAK